MGAAEWIAAAAVGVALASVGVAIASLVLSFITSLVAIGLAIWQGCETRRHNRKSVLAHLGLSFSYAEYSGAPFGLTLSNDGSGPAIIREIEMFLDDVAYTIPEGHPWSKIWPDAGCHSMTFLYSMVNPGGVMRPGESIPLVTEEHGNPSFEEVSEFACALQKINLRIRYTSIYDDPGIVDLKESLGPWVYEPTPPPPAEEVIAV